MKITISGTPGSGKSTVGKLLAKKLGFRHYSIGDFMRELAKEKGVSLDEFSKQAEKSDEIDKKLDKHSAGLGQKEDDFVIDTRLGFHFIPDSFKIMLIVNPKVGAERIMREPRESEKFENIEAGIREIEKRMDSERKRYSQYYGIDIDDESQFDIVIDTSDKTPEEIVGEIVEKIKE